MLVLGLLCIDRWMRRFGTMVVRDLQVPRRVSRMVACCVKIAAFHRQRLLVLRSVRGPNRVVC